MHYKILKVKIEKTFGEGGCLKIISDILNLRDGINFLLREVDQRHCFKQWSHTPKHQAHLYSNADL